MSNADIPLGPAAPARCARHPEVEATGTCARCGTFYCGGCVRQVFGKAWCETCAARPETHYLENLRARLWGKRDGSAWMALVVGVAFAVAALERLAEGGLPALPTVAFLACAATGVCFFLGLRWAREAFIAVPLLFGLACTQQRWVEGIGYFLVFLGVAFLPVYFDTRNQLFFRRPVSRKKLERLWHRNENNPMARRALSLGAGSLLLPVLAPLAILCGVVGLRRVDLEAVPPIGRKAEAIAAIVLGTLVTGVWIAVLWSAVSTKVGFSLGR